MSAFVSRLTSATGTITKQFRLDLDGRLEKRPGGVMERGEYERLAVANIESFATLLPELNSYQALAYGVAAVERVPLVANSMHEAQRPPGAITRTRECFGWADGPGVLMLDYDPPPNTEPLGREALLEALYAACPELRGVGHAWRPSASSCIYHGETELRGIRGQRVYVFVERAGDIPEIGKRIYQRLCLLGHGYYLVSAAGSLLNRTLIDGSVWQPERLDFASGAYCEPPLEQRLPAPLVLGDPGRLLATAVVRDLSPTERQALKTADDKAREAVDSQARTVRAAYIERRGEELAKARGISLEQALGVVRRAVEGCDLCANFELLHAKHGTVTVGEILDNPGQWQGERFADPLEPEYGGSDLRVAWVNLRSGGRPYLYSHAHGGCRYRLVRQPRTLKLQPGEHPRVVDECADILAIGSEVYVRTKEIVAVGDDGLDPQTEWALKDHIERAMNFERFDKRGKMWLPADAPLSLPKTLIATGGRGHLPELRGVCTAPTVFPDGRILDEPGYDAESRLLYVSNEREPLRVPREPTAEDALVAATTLWKPFRLFPFDGPVSRAVHLSALCTAVVRNTLATAPGFAYDAPTAGSGKTLLALCIGALAYPGTPATMGPAKDDEEMRKRLFALSLAGAPVILLDNIAGTLDSPNLCQWLTSEIVKDRILGVSRTGTAPNVALFQATGNNIECAGDLNRRMLRCRLDSREERPDKRAFAFDPLDYVRRHRTELARAVCTLLVAWHRAGCPRGGEGSLASFESWANTIRQVVLWLCSLKFLEVEGVAGLGDPINSIETGFETDPDKARLAAFLSAWYDEFGDNKPTTIAAALRRAEHAVETMGDADPLVRLYAVIDEIAGQGRTINRRILGAWLRRHVGRPCEGYLLRREDDKHAKVSKWSVQQWPPRGSAGSCGDARNDTERNGSDDSF